MKAARLGTLLLVAGILFADAARATPG